MSELLVVTLRNDLAELERVGQLVTQFGEQHRLAAKLAFEVTLALDEVLTNVISYAYDDSRAHQIDVRLSLQGGELSVVVEDDGRPFNPLAIAAPDLDLPLEDRPTGGLGLHLVRTVMDGLEYGRHGNMNRLVMTKTIAS